MGMNYWRFAQAFGQNAEMRRIMIQGTIYLEFEEYYKHLNNYGFGVETTDLLMQELVDYGWEVYLNSDSLSPTEIGMAFEKMFYDYFNEEKFDLFDIKNNFSYYIDLIRK